MRYEFFHVLLVEKSKRIVDACFVYAIFVQLSFLLASKCQMDVFFVVVFYDATRAGFVLKTGSGHACYRRREEKGQNQNFQHVNETKLPKRTRTRHPVCAGLRVISAARLRITLRGDDGMETRVYNTRRKVCSSNSCKYTGRKRNKKQRDYEIHVIQTAVTTTSLVRWLDGKGGIPGSFLSGSKIWLAA